MTNVCVKGKVIERNVVKWLKTQGCHSARRSAQNCGAPTQGSTKQLDNSDIIVPEELPSWHIESKGTKVPKVNRAKLAKWFKQVDEDCPADMLPVIIHTANAYSSIAIVKF